jgi:tryptophan-rich sensory protein
MAALLDRADARGLIANVTGATLLVLLLNGLIFSLGWQDRSPSAPAFLPPPIVIALVWLGLFPCMACARWELNRATTGRVEKVSLLVLFALCATYPLYTGGLRSDVVGETANVALCLMTLGLIVRYRRSAPRAAVFLIPLALWLAFASVAGGFALAAD